MLIIRIIGLVFIVLIYTNYRNKYNRLSQEYNMLLVDIQKFGEWIEREQFIRHEYKNQLAVLFELSNEKEVKTKIKEIINENISINNEIVIKLKDFPKGALKGIIYYKTIVAQKNKINVEISININDKSIIEKLNNREISILTKVIGIIYDNAIDAAKISRKKNIFLEIYELKDKVNIVISNTFKRSSIVNNRFEKGITTKGKNHGIGLYFLKKIIDRNRWLEEKQEIIDNYYIETITIYKK